MQDELFGLSAPLARLLIAIAHSVEQVAEALRFPQPASAEDASDVARNQFGDVQTQADLEADAIVTKCVHARGVPRPYLCVYLQRTKE